MLAALLLACCAPTVAVAASDSAHGIAPPSHRAPEGGLRVWGHPAAATWLDQQTSRFAQRRPDLVVRRQLSGSDVGMAGLYTGQADVVLMGREATESEIKAFEWIHRYRPTAVPVMRGSLDAPGQAPALVVFVHHDNPLRALDLAQLDGIIGSARDNGWHDNQPLPEGSRSAAGDLRSWGALGAGGEWAGAPIRLHLPMAESGSGKFLRTRLIADSNRMHWEAITEHADPVQGPEDSGRRILEAVAADRYALGIASLKYHQPGKTRALALAAAPGAQPVHATADSIRDGRYPLGRTLYAYINRHPGEGVDPNVRAWLAQVLSEAEQNAPSAGYLPLPRAARQASLKLLEPHPRPAAEDR